MYAEYARITAYFVAQLVPNIITHLLKIIQNSETIVTEDKEKMIWSISKMQMSWFSLVSLGL